VKAFYEREWSQEGLNAKLQQPQAWWCSQLDIGKIHIHTRRTARMPFQRWWHYIVPVSALIPIHTWSYRTGTSIGEGRQSLILQKCEKARTAWLKVTHKLGDDALDNPLLTEATSGAEPLFYSGEGTDRLRYDPSVGQQGTISQVNYPLVFWPRYYPYVTWTITGPSRSQVLHSTEGEDLWRTIQGTEVPDATPCPRLPPLPFPSPYGAREMEMEIRTYHPPLHDISRLYTSRPHDLSWQWPHGEAWRATI
jgi:hypothetical protein